MKTAKLSFAFLIIVLHLFAAAHVGAQTPTPTPTPEVVEDVDEVLRVESTLIVVPISVLDERGNAVKNLSPADFTLEEDGTPREIAVLAPSDDVTLEIALVVDGSSGISPLFDFEKRAAAAFLESVLRPQDRATLFVIGQSPILEQERGNAVATASRLRQISLTGRYTAFYDTMLAASAYLKKNAPENCRKVVLALTDGEDNWSSFVRDAEKAAWKDVEKRNLTTAKRALINAQIDLAHGVAAQKISRSLQSGDIVFYNINPHGENELDNFGKRWQKGLMQFAVETGGNAFLPKNVESLKPIFAQLSADLRAQYLLQYYTDADFPPGKFVKLKVNLKNRPNARLRSREGYYSDKNKKPGCLISDVNC